MKKTTLKQNADRFVHAIFCDDIRQEMGNKVSFMGCYQGELFVPVMPLMLPKLCVQVTVSTPIERPLKSLKVRLDQGAIQLATIELPNDTIGRDLPTPPKGSTRWSASFGMMLAPFSITERSELRVVVITEEGEMLGPRLRIEVRPQADAVVTPAEPDEIGAVSRKASPKKAANLRGLTKKAK